MNDVVYGLIDQRDNSVFYVGSTNDVYMRFQEHLRCDGTNAAKDARIQELKAANIMLHMAMFEVVKPDDSTRAREAYWIQHYLHLGAKLLNQRLEIAALPRVAMLPQVEIDSPGYEVNNLCSWEDRRAEVIRLRSLGFKQSEILARLWNVKPGAAKGYSIALAQYKQMLAEIIKTA